MVALPGADSHGRRLESVWRLPVAVLGVPDGLVAGERTTVSMRDIDPVAGFRFGEFELDVGACEYAGRVARSASNVRRWSY